MNLTVVYHALGIALPQDKLTKNIIELRKPLSTSTGYVQHGIMR